MCGGLTLIPPPFPIFPIRCAVYMFYDWQLSCFLNFIKVFDLIFTYHFRANLWTFSIARPIHDFLKNPEDRTYVVGPKLFIKEKWHSRRNRVIYMQYILNLSICIRQNNERNFVNYIINALFPTDLHLFYILN